MQLSNSLIFCKFAISSVCCYRIVYLCVCTCTLLYKYTLADDPTLTQSQELIQEFNYDEQEGCVERWSIQLGKDLHMDYSEIDYESREKIKIKDKHTLSGWLVDARDLVRRQSSQMYLLKEMIECFKTEALADKEKVIGLQGQLLVQKEEQKDAHLKLLKASVEETVQTMVE